MNHNLNQKQNQVTLRGVPISILNELKREAKQKKLSLNQVLLNRIVPSSEKKTEGACATILDLAGTWDYKRSKDFEKTLTEIRKIDAKLWNS